VTIKRVVCRLPAVFLLAHALAGSDLLPGRFFRFERLVPKTEGPATVGFSSIAQDKEGFLWLGTSAGLARYDGNGFRFYRPPSGPGRPLQDIGIYPVTVGRSGEIWLGTDGQGLLRFSRETEEFVRYRHDAADPASLPDDIVLAVQEDPAGRLWVGTRSRGLARLDPATGSFTRVPLGPDADEIWDVLADHQGRIWVGTLGAGLFRIDPQTGEAIHFRHDEGDPGSLGGDSVWTVFEDGGGTVWVGTKNGGLNRLDPGQNGFVRFYGDDDAPRDLASQTITAIGEDSAGRLWLGTVSDGVRVLDRRTGEYAAFRHDPQDPESPGDDNVTSIARDASGLIWIGTVRGGLNKCLAGRAKFELYKRNPSDPRSLGRSDVRALWADGQERLWIGSKGGLEGIDRTTREIRRFSPDPPLAANPGAHSILAIRGDAEGRIWLGTESGGLARWDPDTTRLARYRHDPRDPNSLSNDRVNAVWPDAGRPGVLWVGTHRGLNRFELRANRWTRFLHDPQDAASLCNNIVTALAEDEAGRLWVGTRGGLSRLDKATGRCESFVTRLEDPPGAGISDNIVNCIHVDGAGIVWTGTNGGLNRFDPAERAWQVFAQKDGLAGEVVCGIQEDASGALWVSTNRGLSRLDRGNGALKSYGAWDSLQGGAFNPGACAKDAAGLMFFGGSNGLSAFDPAGAGKNPFVPPVAWTAFSRDNVEVRLSRPLSTLRSLSLSHRSPLVTLEFAALDFAAPEMNSFAFRLEPRDAEWISIVPEHKISLAGLGAGAYTLRVKAANPDGVWNEEGIAIGIEVAPPVWRTWWFLLIAAAFVGSGAVLAAAVRKKIRSVPRVLGEDLEGVIGSYDLTGREEEILRLVLRGARNQDIGRKLFISGSTVRNHISNIYRKLGVRTRLELINRIAADARNRS